VSDFESPLPWFCWFAWVTLGFAHLRLYRPPASFPKGIVFIFICLFYFAPPLLISLMGEKAFTVILLLLAVNLVSGISLAVPFGLLALFIIFGEFKPLPAWLTLSLISLCFTFLFCQGLAGRLGESLPYNGAILRIYARHTVMLSIGFFFFAWTSLSLVDSFYLEPPLKLSPSRFEEIRANSPWKHRKIAVALSGGGYRAALMHAGVLAALEHFKIRTSTLASVSGGSIIASYYALGGDPEQFVAAVTDRRFNLMRRMFNIKSALEMLRLSNRNVQADLLDDVFLGRTRLSGSHIEPAPNLMLVTTDIASGQIVGISASGYLKRNPLVPLKRRDFVNYNPPTDGEVTAAVSGLSTWVAARNGIWPTLDRTATLVSASGAFPLAFDSLNEADMQLADGGIGDNSGMTVLLDMDYFASFCRRPDAASFASWKQDLIISSNASAAFDPSPSHLGRFATAQRAVDMAYARTQMRPFYLEDEAATTSAPPAVELSPDSLILFKGAEFGGRTVAYEVDHARVSKSIAELPESERVYLAKWLLDQPAVDYRSRNLAEEYMEQRSSDILAAGLAIFELPGDLTSFINAQTLTAEYSKREAYALFRLGFLLVALNIGTIQQSLDAHSDEHAPTVQRCPLSLP
jgi:predicted acylesterase/phospholipase RssA